MKGKERELYYPFPLDADALFRYKRVTQVGLKESINQHIELMLQTHYGEHKGDEDFGCLLWEMEFEAPLLIAGHHDGIASAVKQTISRREKRIGEITVKAVVAEDIVVNRFFERPSARRKVSLHIQAVLEESGDPYDFSTEIYINPLTSKV